MIPSGDLRPLGVWFDLGILSHCSRYDLLWKCCEPLLFLHRTTAGRSYGRFANDGLWIHSAPGDRVSYGDTLIALNYRTPSGREKVTTLLKRTHIFSRTASSEDDQRLKETGAGEGNRTLVFSLGSCCSTIELHPLACADFQQRIAAVKAVLAVRCIELGAAAQLRGTQSRPGVTFSRGNAWRVSDPVPDSSNRGPSHRGPAGAPACARRRDGRRSGHLRG